MQTIKLDQKDICKCEKPERDRYATYCKKCGGWVVKDDRLIFTGIKVSSNG